jgi:hypothetical protein
MRIGFDEDTVDEISGKLEHVGKRVRVVQIIVMMLIILIPASSVVGNFIHGMRFRFAQQAEAQITGFEGFEGYTDSSFTKIRHTTAKIVYTVGNEQLRGEVAFNQGMEIGDMFIVYYIPNKPSEFTQTRSDLPFYSAVTLFFAVIYLVLTIELIKSFKLIRESKTYEGQVAVSSGRGHYGHYDDLDDPNNPYS